MKALLSIVTVVASTVFARHAPPASFGEAGTASAPQAAPPAGAPAPPPNFVYEPDGRRDPFVSLANRGAESGSGAFANARPEGLSGVLVDEVVVRGILESRGGWIAMIGSPNGRTYTVRPGDRLLDGSVQAITPQSVVLLQEVNDPLSLAKQREVRKYIRSGEAR